MRSFKLCDTSFSKPPTPPSRLQWTYFVYQGCRDNEGNVPRLVPTLGDFSLSVTPLCLYSYSDLLSRFFWGGGGGGLGFIFRTRHEGTTARAAQQSSRTETESRVSGEHDPVRLKPASPMGQLLLTHSAMATEGPKERERESESKIFAVQFVNTSEREMKKKCFIFVLLGANALKRRRSATHFCPVRPNSLS